MQFLRAERIDTWYDLHPRVRDALMEDCELQDRHDRHLQVFVEAGGTALREIAPAAHARDRDKERAALEAE